MAAKFSVIGWRVEEGTEVGKFDSAIELALAMWELGLQRPEFDSITIQELTEEPSVFITDGIRYLVNKYGCSVGTARRALNESHGSVIHASILLEEMNYHDVEKGPSA